ncbi:MAG: helix-turn-helix domain-containing protein [Pseudolabrys sp.]
MATLASKRETKLQVSRGSGNVFADLGFADADERQTKLRLAYELNEVLAERDLTQQESGRLLGLSQPKISALGNYKLEGFSVERLMTLLTALDRDIDIVIRKKRKSRTPGRITVVPA